MLLIGAVDAEKDELNAFIKTHALKPVMLINTHCHLDHVFGNKMMPSYKVSAIAELKILFYL